MNDLPTSKYGDAMQQNAIPVTANVTGIMRIFDILISFFYFISCKITNIIVSVNGK